MSTELQLADPEYGTLDDLINTNRYGLGKSALVDDRKRLAAQTLDQLTRHGAATLKGFIRPEILPTLVEQIEAAAKHVQVRRHSATVYSRPDLEAGLPDEDPRCTKQEWNAGHVTRDMIAPHTIAHRLYVAPAFKSFIAQSVGIERVYEYGDPLAGLVATVLPPGGQYPWHYDTNEFVVTVMVQKPDGGGRFEYHQNLRSPGDENLAGLTRVIAGQDTPTAKVIDAEPGDLQLFLGRHSLHRVTEVTGNSARHVLVLSYADRPNVIGPVDRTRSVYGRVTEAHLVAAESRTSGTDGLIL